MWFPSWRGKIELPTLMVKGWIKFQFDFVISQLTWKDWTSYSNGERLNKIPIWLCDFPVDVERLNFLHWKLQFDFVISQLTWKDYSSYTENSNLTLWFPSWRGKITLPTLKIPIWLCDFPVDVERLLFLHWKFQFDFVISQLTWKDYSSYTENSNLTLWFPSWRGKITLPTLKTPIWLCDFPVAVERLLFLHWKLQFDFVISQLTWKDYSSYTENSNLTLWFPSWRGKITLPTLKTPIWLCDFPVDVERLLFLHWKFQFDFVISQSTWKDYSSYTENSNLTFWFPSWRGKITLPTLKIPIWLCDFPVDVERLLFLHWKFQFHFVISQLTWKDYSSYTENSNLTLWFPSWRGKITLPTLKIPIWLCDFPVDVERLLFLHWKLQFDFLISQLTWKDYSSYTENSNLTLWFPSWRGKIELPTLKTPIWLCDFPVDVERLLFLHWKLQFDFVISQLTWKDYSSYTENSNLTLWFPSWRGKITLPTLKIPIWLCDFPVHVERLLFLHWKFQFDFVISQLTWKDYSSYTENSNLTLWFPSWRGKITLPTLKIPIWLCDFPVDVERLLFLHWKLQFDFVISQLTWKDYSSYTENSNLTLWFPSWRGKITLPTLKTPIWLCDFPVDVERLLFLHWKFQFDFVISQLTWKDYSSYTENSNLTFWFPSWRGKITLPTLKIPIWLCDFPVDVERLLFLHWKFQFDFVISQLTLKDYSSYTENSNLTLWFPSWRGKITLPTLKIPIWLCDFPVDVERLLFLHWKLQFDFVISQLTWKDYSSYTENSNLTLWFPSWRGKITLPTLKTPIWLCDFPVDVERLLFLHWKFQFDFVISQLTWKDYSSYTENPNLTLWFPSWRGKITLPTLKTPIWLCDFPVDVERLLFLHWKFQFDFVISQLTWKDYSSYTENSNLTLWFPSWRGKITLPTLKTPIWLCDFPVDVERLLFLHWKFQFDFVISQLTWKDYSSYTENSNLTLSFPSWRGKITLPTLKTPIWLCDFPVDVERLLFLHWKFQFDFVISQLTWKDYSSYTENSNLTLWFPSWRGKITLPTLKIPIWLCDFPVDVERLLFLHWKLQFDFVISQLTWKDYSSYTENSNLTLWFPSWRGKITLPTLKIPIWLCDFPVDVERLLYLHWKFQFDFVISQLTWKDYSSYTENSNLTLWFPSWRGKITLSTLKTPIWLCDFPVDVERLPFLHWKFQFDFVISQLTWKDYSSYTENSNLTLWFPSWRWKITLPTLKTPIWLCDFPVDVERLLFLHWKFQFDFVISQLTWKDYSSYTENSNLTLWFPSWNGKITLPTLKIPIWLCDFPVDVERLLFLHWKLQFDFVISQLTWKDYSSYTENSNLTLWFPSWRGKITLPDLKTPIWLCDFPVDVERLLFLHWKFQFDFVISQLTWKDYSSHTENSNLTLWFPSWRGKITLPTLKTPIWLCDFPVDVERLLFLHWKLQFDFVISQLTWKDYSSYTENSNLTLWFPSWRGKITLPTLKIPIWLCDFPVDVERLLFLHWKLQFDFVISQLTWKDYSSYTENSNLTLWFPSWRGKITLPTLKIPIWLCDFPVDVERLLFLHWKFQFDFVISQLTWKDYFSYTENSNLTLWFPSWRGKITLPTLKTPIWLCDFPVDVERLLFLHWKLQFDFVISQLTWKDYSSYTKNSNLTLWFPSWRGKITLPTLKIPIWLCDFPVDVERLLFLHWKLQFDFVISQLTWKDYSSYTENSNFTFWFPSWRGKITLPTLKTPIWLCHFPVDVERLLFLHWKFQFDFVISQLTWKDYSSYTENANLTLWFPSWRGKITLPTLKIPIWLCDFPVDVERLLFLHWKFQFDFVISQLTWKDYSSYTENSNMTLWFPSWRGKITLPTLKTPIWLCDFPVDVERLLFLHWKFQFDFVISQLTWKDYSSYTENSNLTLWFPSWRGKITLPTLKTPIWLCHFPVDVERLLFLHWKLQFDFVISQLTWKDYSSYTENSNLTLWFPSWREKITLPTLKIPIWLCDFPVDVERLLFLHWKFQFDFVISQLTWKDYSSYTENSNLTLWFPSWRRKITLPTLKIPIWLCDFPVDVERLLFLHWKLQFDFVISQLTWKDYSSYTENSNLTFWFPSWRGKITLPTLKTPIWLCHFPVDVERLLFLHWKLQFDFVISQLTWKDYSSYTENSNLTLWFPSWRGKITLPTLKIPIWLCDFPVDVERLLFLHWKFQFDFVISQLTWKDYSSYTENSNLTLWFPSWRGKITLPTLKTPTWLCDFPVDVERLLFLHWKFQFDFVISQLTWKDYSSYTENSNLTLWFPSWRGKITLPTLKTPIWLCDFPVDVERLLFLHWKLQFDFVISQLTWKDYPSYTENSNLTLWFPSWRGKITLPTLKIPIWLCDFPVDVQRLLFLHWKLQFDFLISQLTWKDYSSYTENSNLTLWFPSWRGKITLPTLKTPIWLCDFPVDVERLLFLHWKFQFDFVISQLTWKDYSSYTENSNLTLWFPSWRGKITLPTLKIPIWLCDFPVDVERLLFLHWKFQFDFVISQLTWKDYSSYTENSNLTLWFPSWRGKITLPTLKIPIWLCDFPVDVERLLFLHWKFQFDFVISQLTWKDYSSYTENSNLTLWFPSWRGKITLPTLKIPISLCDFPVDVERLLFLHWKFQFDFVISQLTWKDYSSCTENSNLTLWFPSWRGKITLPTMKIPI